MKAVDAPLPMPGGPAPILEPIVLPPADRSELLDLLTRITQQAKMPDGVKRARFVRIPAQLYMDAHAIVRRELVNIAAAEQ